MNDNRPTTETEAIDRYAEAHAGDPATIGLLDLPPMPSTVYWQAQARALTWAMDRIAAACNPALPPLSRPPRPVAPTKPSPHQVFYYACPRCGKQCDVEVAGDGKVFSRTFCPDCEAPFDCGALETAWRDSQPPTE